MRLYSFVVTMALLAPAAVAGDVREAGADLRHADGGFLPYAKGVVSIREGADFQRFTVQVWPGADHVNLRAQITDTGDHFVDLGAVAPTSFGLAYNVTTQGDGRLPLGVEHAGSLSGHWVRVLDGDGHVILVGAVPAFEEHHEPAPDPKPEPTERPTELRAKAAMIRPEHSPYDDSRGVMFVARRSDGSEVLGFEVGHLAPATHYNVYLGDDGDGVFAFEFTTNGEGGAGRSRDTARGDELPGDASLAELAGRHVEIRHGDDVVLFGAVPRLEDEHDVEPVRERERHKDEDSGCVARVDVKIRPREGHERLEMNLDHLPRERHDDDRHDGIREGEWDHHEGDDGHEETHDEGGDDSGDEHRDGGEAKRAKRRARADVYLEDSSGVLQPIGSPKINGRGRAKLRYSTRRGGSLPLGAATLRELAGRAFEVRVNGTTVLSGTLPNF
jgi:hypothetical protein